MLGLQNQTSSSLGVGRELDDVSKIPSDLFWVHETPALKLWTFLARNLATDPKNTYPVVMKSNVSGYGDSNYILPLVLALSVTDDKTTMMSAFDRRYFSFDSIKLATVVVFS
jgi:hypothetical protein